MSSHESCGRDMFLIGFETFSNDISSPQFKMKMEMRVLLVHLVYLQSNIKYGSLRMINVHTTASSWEIVIYYQGTLGILQLSLGSHPGNITSLQECNFGENVKVKKMK